MYCIYDQNIGMELDRTIHFKTEQDTLFSSIVGKFIMVFSNWQMDIFQVTFFYA